MEGAAAGITVWRKTNKYI